MWTDSCSAVGVNIQTNCKSGASPWDYYYLMVSSGFTEYVWSMRTFITAVSANIVLYIVVSSYMTMYLTLRYCKAQVLQQSEPSQLNNFPDSV